MMIMNLLQQIFSKSIIDRIFNEDPSIEDLIVITITATIFWTIFFTVVCKTFDCFFSNAKWLHIAAINDYHRGGKKMNQDLGIDQTEEEFIIFFKSMWPWTQCVGIQHAVGGILCIPSVFNLVDTSTGANLVALGILSEIGWEIGDMITWIHKRYFAINGKEKVPFALLIILGAHHSLSSILGIPAILYYRNLKTLHWICFELQGAAAIALGVNEYTKLLDISIPSQLIQFQVFTGIAVLIMAFCRLVHWPILVYQFTCEFYKDEAWIMMTISLILSVLFTLFSLFVCVIPFARKFMKFLHVSAEYKSLPANVDSNTRRSSLLSMKLVADDIMTVLPEPTVQDELVDIFLSRSNKYKIERRATAPATSTITDRRRRRSSTTAFLRATVSTTISEDMVAAIQRVQKDITSTDKED